ncbi:MAG: protein phosphatase 2C domain-containing protein, partial [Gammaproteobacteria bacterium]|nr:protein phosphatase 2C domain-containing protein [Gammaproteobacteria bacterium]
CNAELRTIAISEMNNNTIGSTLASVLIYQKFCAYMWVGDSRIYRLRSNNLIQLSRDHSQVEELIDQGLLLRENAESHPDANVITRAIGADDSLYVDINVDEVKIDDTFLICSDGLSKHVNANEIEGILSHGSAIDMCTRLIKLTLERGATDNVTVSIIKVLAK